MYYIACSAYRVGLGPGPNKLCSKDTGLKWSTGGSVIKTGGCIHSQLLFGTACEEKLNIAWLSM